MDEVARLAARDRSDLFRAAAEAMGVTVQLIEKDFWVCWSLRQVFSLEALPAGLLFKGGTSLSKVFRVIDRMSEDIDLVIDRADLGFTGDRDPAAVGIGGHERNRRISALKEAAADFVAGPMLGALRDRCTTSLEEEDRWSLLADVASLDNPRILFTYPSIEPPPGYLRPSVQLEFGARGEMWPAISGTITPYAAERFPRPFREPTVTVRTLAAERTFWEKATILHAIAHRDAARHAAHAKRARPTRHYFDVFRLWQHGIGRKAAEDRSLLADVVRHKQLFFRDPKARHERALAGTLRLVPDGRVMAAIRPDYEAMVEEMVFGAAPSLDEVMDTLAQIEAAVNG